MKLPIPFRFLTNEEKAELKDISDILKTNHAWNTKDKRSRRTLSRHWTEEHSKQYGGLTKALNDRNKYNINPAVERLNNLKKEIKERFKNHG